MPRRLRHGQPHFRTIVGFPNSHPCLPTKATQGGVRRPGQAGKLFRFQSRFRSEKSHGEGITQEDTKKHRQATNPLIGLGLPVYGVAYYDLVFLPSACS